MFIAQYPEERSTHERRLNSMARSNEMKKIKSSSAKSIIISAVIFVLSAEIEILWIKLIVIIIGLSSLFTAFMLYRLTAEKYDARNYTKIFDDKIIHSQTTLITSKQEIYTIFFSDIEKSAQNSIGYLEMTISSDGKSEAEILSKKGKRLSFGECEEKIILKFSVQDGKYYLIKNLSDEIKYARR